MSLISRLLGQCRCPRGWVGRLLARSMNLAHGPMTRWALSLVASLEFKRVLDVGCGGGATLARLANLMPGAEVHGVDYSPEALKVAAHTNRHLIEQKRVFISEGSVSELPYEADRFDLVVAIESHFFWPDLTQDLGETGRVLRPGGVVALAGGAYFGGRFDSLNRRLAAGGRMNCQTLPELRDALCEAGYAHVAVHEQWGRGWFCVTGCKPSRMPSRLGRPLTPDGKRS